MTKIVAMYLPQYHRIPENDMWWGEGYTDWKAVKDAKALYKTHRQPRVPINKFYYDLSDGNVIKHQAEVASRYGVYGFGVYHYWFNSNQVLLDKPAYLIKDNKDISTHYFFMWDNGSWKRTWSNVKFSNSWAPLYEHSNSGPEILAKLDYGNKTDWKKHFDYLLPFFKDERYIQIDGKPLFGVFNQDNDSSILKEMFEYWDDLAKENGLNGVATLGRTNLAGVVVTDYQFDYEPCTHGWIGKSVIQRFYHKAVDGIRIKFKILKTYSYKRVWKRIINDISDDKCYFPGAFVRYDDTPRRGNKSSIVIGESPEIFEDNMREFLKKCEEKKKDFAFITAWNEWGEGAYLEPDEDDGYAYLEALRNAINK